ncbi:XK-related protein 6-like [Branchiostoma lanceolatum]|uniref:XK-related protein 6-like n=1 Tax=Branchiostoma lanceolatum TaxID=7740 RepID=UPI003455BC79
MGCLGSIWDSKQRKILFIVVFPLGLYLFGVITDLSLAVQYYYSGDFTWFGLTLGFVLGPSIIINLFSLAISWNEGETECTFIRSLKTLLAILQLGEQVSVLKVITMVISLLAAVKAVVTLFYYDIIKEENRTFSCGFVTRFILLTVWKVVELSARVLAVALFAAAFKPWIALPIGLHWLVMTVTLVWIKEDYRGWGGVMVASLTMAPDTFKITFSMDHKRTFWLNTVLTLLGNITMVTVWYTLQTGQYWYDVPALVGVVVGSLVSAGLGFIERSGAEIKFLLTFCCEEQDPTVPDPETLKCLSETPSDQQSQTIPDPETPTYTEFVTTM